MKKCPKCGREYEDANTLCPSDGAVLEKTSDDLIGRTLADKYRIEELLNRGGMGAVYRGTHVLMDKTVAIKVLHPALAADDKIVARFTREAKAASRISHPHALSVTDFGEAENGIVFLVMEYLRGRTLKEVIHEEGSLTLPRATEIIKQVSGALDEAHSQGVVHRDLKSDNIMLVDMGGEGDWAKVLDFGIAKIVQPIEQDPALTSPNLIIGTPQYMSPEQCSQAADIDARSDIYSLGVILYEMLVGHVPFTGESPTAIMMKHLQEPPPSVLEERRDLPAAVDKVVARALAKRPEDRYQSASQLVEALNLAAEESPIVAAAAADTVPDTPQRSTSRIVVPTGESEAARTTISEADDEETVVRPRETSAPLPLNEKMMAVETAPASSFNPWRIVIPAFAGLLVLFAVIYAVSSWRNSNAPATNANTQPMPVDRNGRPVQPAPPATGQGEQGILPAAPAVVPSVTTNANGAIPATANPGETRPPGQPEPSVENTQGNENPQQEQAPPSPEPQQKPSDSPQTKSSPTPRPLPSPAESQEPAATPQQREAPSPTPRQLPQPSNTDSSPLVQPTKSKDEG
ncbi:MAG: hypothetical protein AUG51_02610 [Acidobacteria bacterium 13_1_20CM_3_53_8]|nr:MAG: hypothetical protein AUG51_02610 [Acidobacteria bacterium 13_1_20CM_3_53_8]